MGVLTIEQLRKLAQGETFSSNMSRVEMLAYFKSQMMQWLNIFECGLHQYQLDATTLLLCQDIITFGTFIINKDNPLLKDKNGDTFVDIVIKLEPKVFDPGYDDIAYDGVEWVHNDAWCAVSSWEDWCLTVDNNNT